MIVSALLEQEERWENVSQRLLRPEATLRVEEGEEGALEKVAKINESLESLVEATGGIGNDVENVGDVFTHTKIPRNLSPRQALPLAGKIANDLEEPSKRLETHCDEYAKQMKELDKGIDGVIELYQLFKSTSGSTSEMGLSKTRDRIAELLSTVEEPMEQIDSMRSTLNDFSRLARVLRRPCQRIDAALDDIVSSKLIMESWEEKLGYALAAE